MIITIFRCYNSCFISKAVGFLRAVEIKLQHHERMNIIIGVGKTFADHDPIETDL